MPPSVPQQAHITPHDHTVASNKPAALSSDGGTLSSSHSLKLRKGSARRDGVKGTRKLLRRRSTRKQNEEPAADSAVTPLTDNALISSSEEPTSIDITSNALGLNGVSNTSMLSPYGLGNAGMMGMYSYGSPYGMMGSPMMTGGPFSGLYQALFGFQNVIFSIGQVVQILGMNQQAMHQVFDSISSMLDHAVASYNELRALEAIDMERETEEQKKKRRRLKAIRWALVAGTSCLVYKILRRLVSSPRRPRLGYGGHGGNSYTTGNLMNSHASGSGLYHGYGYGGSPMMHGPSVSSSSIPGTYF